MVSGRRDWSRRLVPTASDPHLAALGRQIRQHRENAGLTIEALAEAAALSPRGLAYLEAGQRDARYSTLRALAAGLKTTTAGLLAGL